MADPVNGNIKERIKKSYDAIAEEYFAKFTKEDDPLRLGYLRQLNELLRKNGKDAVDILELGCGSGIPATKFMLESSNPICHVVGNDISTTQLKHARSNLASFGDRITLMEGDMLSLEFPESKFDAITGFYSIVHLPREEQHQLMSKIFQWMKPGGFFLATFVADDLPDVRKDNWMGHEKGWMLWSGWGVEGSLKMVEGAGFDVLLQNVHQDAGDSEYLWVLASKGTC